MPNTRHTRWMRKTCAGAILATCVGAAVAAPSNPVQAQDQARLDLVRQYANNVLKAGADTYNTPATPLLADGVNPRTGEQLKWIFPNGREAVLTNLSCQQNLMRVLTSLSALTGDDKYQHAARQSMAYFLKNYQDKNGLLRWGGHQFIDLRTLQVVGPDEKNGVHELKNGYPYYDLMFEVNPQATTRFIRAFWNAHVYDWPTLEIGRHGEYDKAIDTAKLWNTNPFAKQPPYFETKGLSFLNAGNDLIYAAAMLNKRNGDAPSLLWAHRLADQFVSARNPVTKLGAYQFSQPRAVCMDENSAEYKAGQCTMPKTSTHSALGDRAQRQLGPDFEPQPVAADPTRRRVLEAKMLRRGEARTIYSENALMELQIGGELGAQGKDFLNWTHDGLVAFAKYAYNPATNTFKPMLTDGTDLSGFVLKRDGYYGKAGSKIMPYEADSAFLVSYARAFLITGDKALWTTARNIARANDLGDLGKAPGKGAQVKLATRNNDPYALFAVLDIYRQTHTPAYLDLARAIGNNIAKDRFHYGFFMPGADYMYANFDAIEPYALLALDAAIKHRDDAVPPFINGGGFTEGAYLQPDGKTPTLQDKVLFRVLTNGKRADQLDE